jgi:hypothetical protein
MTHAKDEALQMCLEYIETDAHERKYVRHAIKQALAAPTVQEPVEVDQDTMELAESVGLIGPASRTHGLYAAIQRFHDLICVNATIKAAKMAADAIRESTPPAQPAPVQHDECVVCGDKVRVIPRPWVGLTETEVEAYDSWADFQVGCGRQTLFDMVRDIEAKLKGKNHDQ